MMREWSWVLGIALCVGGCTTFGEQRRAEKTPPLESSASADGKTAEEGPNDATSARNGGATVVTWRYEGERAGEMVDEYEDNVTFCLYDITLSNLTLEVVVASNGEPISAKAKALFRETAITPDCQDNFSALEYSLSSSLPITSDGVGQRLLFKADASRAALQLEGDCDLKPAEGSCSLRFRGMDRLELETVVGLKKK